MKSPDPCEPFYKPLPLAAVGLFVTNNFWLKTAFPGVITGKLSDICACFFMPLFLAAVLREFTPGALHKRVGYGSAVTAVMFLLVKGTNSGSEILNSFVSRVTASAGFSFRPNIADPTDLVALPFIVLSATYALPRFAARDSEGASSSPNQTS